MDDFVAFPEFLDLTPFLAPKKSEIVVAGKEARSKHKRKEEEKCVYRLYAVVVHIGTMTGGHYIAYTALPPPLSGAKTSSQPSSPDIDSIPSAPPAPPIEPDPANAKRQWAYVSDTVVKLTTLEEVLKAKAYICMYERL